ncbi:carboxymuconolactone decarboxylase [Cupriavidus basilensis OR16]|uniref:Carboxymuconolactone decarboxylase n=1 Tax=Cupriavidus basilensis OR16 TaxID=1127483 RepID=H1S0V9_9BURK|nr:hypothetical protein [Cupriavidus basilensis]EHP43775.1 carboxymuconolactone decarboxylase [Cupriavidus basilensis OR16]
MHPSTAIVFGECGFVPTPDVDALPAASYMRQNILDVIRGVAKRVMGTSTNHIVHTE